MLNVRNRLRKRKEFSYIYRKGNDAHTRFLAVHFVTTKMRNAKVGFSVSNKIGNSVVRHKVKRRLSEIVRQDISSLPLYNYVFVAKQGIDALSFEELQCEVRKVIDKVGDFHRGVSL